MSKYEGFEYIKTIEDLNEVVDVDNWTHFHYICRYNYSNLEVIKYCIENGADFNIKDNFNDTPFSFICDEMVITKEVLKYCLENGADLTIEDEDGYAPFNDICFYMKHLITICKPYMNEYDYIKTLKEENLNWKGYV